MTAVGRDIYDKMRADLRLSKEEAQRIETSRAPKVNFAFVSCYVKTFYIYLYVLLMCTVTK